MKRIEGSEMALYSCKASAYAINKERSLLYPSQHALLDNARRLAGGSSAFGAGEFGSSAIHLAMTMEVVPYWILERSRLTT